MKKILLMLAVVVASTGMLSAQSVTKQNPTTESLIQQWQQKTRLPDGAIQRLLYNADPSSRVKVLGLFRQFIKDIGQVNSNDTAAAFGAIGTLCKEYIKQADSIEPSDTQAFNIPFTFANGKEARLASYMSTEIKNLPENERSFYYSCADNLLDKMKDICKSELLLPSDFQRDLNVYRNMVKSSEELNSSFVLQSLLPVMDSFNQYIATIPALGSVMANELQQPLKAGWGGKVVTSEFIKHHSSEVPASVQYELDTFADQLERLAK